MGIRNSIRNFFYAATHANQLIESNQSLLRERMDNDAIIKMQKREINGMKERIHGLMQQKSAIRKSLSTVMPKPTLDQLKIIYEQVRGLDKSGGAWRQDSGTIGYSYLMRFPGGAAELERIRYIYALVEMGVLPENQQLNKLSEEMKQSIRNELGGERLSSSMPVGRIDCLNSHGSIGYSVFHNDAAEFIEEVMDNNYHGVPTQITVYSDPQTGAHIDTSWRLALDPPPQGFQIRPYDPVANLTAHFTREQLAEEVDKRIILRVAIESTDDYTEPGFGQDTVDIDVQNEDGSYGRVVDKYRIVTISNEGDRLVSMTRPYDSYEAAMATVQGNPSVKVVSYDELVHEVGARKGIRNPAYDLNQYSTEQIQQAIDQLDNCPAVEAPAPSPVPEFELEI